METKKTNQEEETRIKFNNLKKYYDQTWDLRDHTLHVGLFNHETKTLEQAYDNATEYLIEKINKIKLFEKNSFILDAGCGAGRTLILLCERYGCSGIGVDLSDEMIKDANQHLDKINTEKERKGLIKLNIKFIRGSGSRLNKILKEDGRFTHIISQDALFLVADKYSLYKNLYRLLKKDGILGIDDFLGESNKEEFGKRQKELIYKMVNWSESLSFYNYKKILRFAGFNILSAEKRDEDMIKTYTFLTKRMKKYVLSNDSTFKNLQDRYRSIVNAVKDKKMGWGIFIAKK